MYISLKSYGSWPYFGLYSPNLIAAIWFSSSNYFLWASSASLASFFFYSSSAAFFLAWIALNSSNTFWLWRIVWENSSLKSSSFKSFLILSAMQGNLRIWLILGRFDGSLLSKAPRILVIFLLKCTGTSAYFP